MGESVTFTFDTAVFSLAAIKKAALRYAGHYVVDINISNNKATIAVTLAPKSASPFPGPPTDQFPNDVLDQDLREAVALETKDVTQLLLAQAFSNLALTDPACEATEFGDDPHEIAKPAGPAPKRVNAS